MAQAHFSYSDPLEDVQKGGRLRAHAARLPFAISIFADRSGLCAEIQEDAANAGLRLDQVATLTAFSSQISAQDGLSLADLTVVDCPQPAAADLAALAQLDILAARKGGRLIVSTTLEGLDAVFGCLDQSNALILISPSRSERVLALGRAMLEMPQRCLRELSEEDRLALLRLTEQVGQIAQRLDMLSSMSSDRGEDEGESAFNFASPRLRFTPGEGDGTSRLVRSVRPPLPDPRLIRRIMRQRRLRSRYFEGDLFADPAWDMLLDLAAAHVEHTRVSVTSLCIASGVPPTTALRWITQMIDAGLFVRIEDETDRRRAFIGLTDKAIDGVARFFAEAGKQAARMV